MQIRKAKYLIRAVALLALTFSLASAYDPGPLQDCCVFVNGKFCNDPKLTSANDFFFSGLNVSRSTSNPLRSNVTAVNVDNLARLNTLGISLAHVDFAPYGLNPPHIHPCGSEFIIVLEGTLYVGFDTSNGDGNRLFTIMLYPGDVFVFLIGLIHFLLNVGNTNAIAFAGLSSQNPGVITIANAAFQVDKNLVEYLQKQF
ncbi:hypothetical protein CIPAW_06G140200 [Carya illinoinensis]|uniref:Cupin type-1 domain-containing protein n=1 Tax=Carya illinoinensis TaxID=32201 RepID=A0A8T1QC10_CARIL|nr:hypothetical protein CIPAW_06G140200 [Carya illinoinensis]